MTARSFSEVERVSVTSPWSSRAEFFQNDFFLASRRLSPKKEERKMRIRTLYPSIICAALLGATAVFASGVCRLTVRNASGSSIGSIDSDGTFRSASGSSIGRFEDGGTIRNASGSSIGRVDPDGTIRNASGSSVGEVEQDGTLRGSSGSSIGRIDADGTVRGASGSSRGRFDGYVPACRHAAAAYLFFFEPLHTY